MNDSFTDFLSQSGVLNLLISVIVLGAIWLVLFTWAVRRANERRRRRQAGEAPLPNIFNQFMNLVQGWLGPNYTSKPAFAEIPSPSMEDLTSDLPEPDFGSLTMGSNPPPAEAPRSETPEASLSLSSPTVEKVSLSENVVETHDNTMYTNTEEPPIEEIAPRAERPLPLAAEPIRNTEGIYVSGSNMLPTDAVEVMKIWRDLNDGALIIQIGDRVFQTIPELQNRGHAQRFINIVEELARIAHAGAVAFSMKPPNFEKNSALFSQQGDWARRDTADTIPTPPSPTNSAEIQLMQVSASPGSIAEQIEDLLQMRLSQTPAFKQRSIHVRPSIGGTLRIEVDGMYYEHVDEIIDPDVRDYIQNVIREWEARQ